MKITAFIQARMSSSRLPGKVMEDIMGLPMILRQIERVRQSRLVNEVVVVTSIDRSDDVLSKLLDDYGIKYFRGSLNDVLSRFVDALSQIECDVAMRLTADCPLIDAAVLDATIESHIQAGADYSSNFLDRRFPRGLDCEVFQPSVLHKLSKLNLTDSEREHVTLGIYSRPDQFLLNGFSNQNDESNRRWTVDFPSDLEFVRVIYKNLLPRDPHFTSDDIRFLLEQNPDFENTEL